MRAVLQNMSAAAKKKAKKKAKDKEKKAKEKEAGAAKGPKVTAAVRRMQEAQEARLKAEAEAKAAEEERVRRVSRSTPHLSTFWTATASARVKHSKRQHQGFFIRQLDRLSDQLCQ